MCEVFTRSVKSLIILCVNVFDIEKNGLDLTGIKRHWAHIKACCACFKSLGIKTISSS